MARSRSAQAPARCPARSMQQRIERDFSDASVTRTRVVTLTGVAWDPAADPVDRPAGSPVRCSPLVSVRPVAGCSRRASARSPMGCSLEPRARPSRQPERWDRARRSSGCLETSRHHPSSAVSKDQAEERSDQRAGNRCRCTRRACSRATCWSACSPSNPARRPRRLRHLDPRPRASMGRGGPRSGYTRE